MSNTVQVPTYYKGEDDEGLSPTGNTIEVSTARAAGIIDMLIDNTLIENGRGETLDFQFVEDALDDYGLIDHDFVEE